VACGINADVIGCYMLVETILRTFPFLVEEGGKMQMESLSSFLWWFIFTSSTNLLPPFQTYTHTGVLKLNYQFVQSDSRFHV
jgi:hypothetical protein